MLAAFTAGNFFHSWLLVLVADVGDKTFMLAAAFAVWCPWCGIREHSAGLAALEIFLLFVGCSGALVLRTILLAFGVNPFDWSGFCNVAAMVILLLFWVKAFIEWRQFLAGGDSDGIGAGDGQVPAIKNDAEYGSVTLADTWAKASRDSWLRVLPTALVLPGLAILFAEASDRSQGALEYADHHRADLALGASLGFACSVALAILCGHAFKSQVSRRWLHFWICVVLGGVAVCCLRDALVRLVLGSIPVV